MILTLIPYDGQTWIIDDGKSYAAVVLDTLLINICKKNLYARQRNIRIMSDSHSCTITTRGTIAALKAQMSNDDRHILHVLSGSEVLLIVSVYGVRNKS